MLFLALFICHIASTRCVGAFFILLCLIIGSIVYINIFFVY